MNIQSIAETTFKNLVEQIINTRTDTLNNIFLLKNDEIIQVLLAPRLSGKKSKEDYSRFIRSLVKIREPDAVIMFVICYITDSTNYRQEALTILAENIDGEVLLQAKIKRKSPKKSNSKILDVELISNDRGIYKKTLHAAPFGNWWIPLEDIPSIEGSHEELRRSIYTGDNPSAPQALFVSEDNQ